MNTTSERGSANIHPGSIGIVLELLLVLKYFKLFGWKDSWIIKYAVIFVTCVDVVAVIVVCEWVYVIGIKHFTVSDTPSP